MASAEDESRYGRMCLLMLNICPKVLRQVVDHQCTATPYTDFEDALRRNSHSLFHLRFRKCCCGSVNTVTPLTKPQWELLYCRVPAATCTTSATCRHPYQAIPGVTSAVMDVTLCCLILRNLFSSMSMTDVETVRTVRNELIHATSACLDSTTFHRAWSAVSQALLNLANSVSTTCTNDTSVALIQLKDRIIDPSELQALADIMKDHRNYMDLNDKMNSLQAVQHSSKAERQMNTSRIQELQSQLLLAETQQRSHESRLQNIIQNERRLQSQFRRIETRQKFQETQRRFQETEHRMTTSRLELDLRRQERQAVEQREVTAALALDVQQQAVTIAEMRSTTNSQKQCITQEDHQYLQDNLVNNYEDATQCIPVIPLRKVALPLNRLFSPVVVAEEINSRKMTRKEMPSERKQIQKTVEIFYNEGKPVERIFMKGEAGRGKTVYGLKLSEEWCKVKQGIQSDMLEVLSQFEFLFHVSMRYVEPDKTKVVDMICDSLSKGDDHLIRLITRVLRDNGIRCLVILDGLDEWSTNSDEFPNIYGLVNCVLFITTRPWKLENLQMDYTPRDKVVEILGINPKSINTLITRIVTELYGSDDQVLTNRLISYCQQRAEDPKLIELMKLPMILTASCYVWCEEETDDSEPRTEKKADKSMTYFSLALVDMLIQRAEKNNKEVKDYLKKHCNEQTVPKSTTHSMMALLCEFFPKIVNFLDILTPLCKVAYNDLMSKQTCLVFRREKLEKEIGTSTVELALKVGIISQCWAPGRGMNIQNVSVSFFHKLIQEIMAAIYIIRCPDGLQTLCDQCPSLDKVLDLSNVFMYVSGLDSSVGCVLSQHVARVTETDHDIALYRQEMEEGEDKVRRLYHSHLTCYREMVHVSSMMGIPHPPPYHISDVYLGYDSDSEVVRVTGEIMSYPHQTVVSVRLWCVPDVSGVIQYLPQHSQTLTALCIMRCDVQSGERLVTVLPLLVHLQCVGYGGDDRDVDAGVVAALTRLTRLKYVWLWDIPLGNTPLCVSHMTQLETLGLWYVCMTARGWGELVSRLLSIPHKVKVTLGWTDIDADSITRILSSPQVTLIQHYTDSDGSTWELVFYNKT